MKNLEYRLAHFKISMMGIALYRISNFKNVEADKERLNNEINWRAENLIKVKQ